ncbi:MAG: thiamine phosphate synthase, partial [Halarsenatibacteraceae bacterium]
GIDFIINDRVDLALALNADGVHLGQSDFPLTEARRIIGADKIIGISSHTLEEMESAWSDGADYLGVGAVFSTDSKQVDKAKDGIGSSGIKRISEKTSLPIVAVGGLNKNNCCQIIDSGADTISVISAITQALNIAEETKQFKDKIITAKSGGFNNGIN